MLGTVRDVLVLRLEDNTAVSWVGFDSVWYVRRYPQVAQEVAVDDGEQVLEFYLTMGQQLGHSPNLWFDEQWYLRQHPDVAAAIRDGKYASGFDEYCQAGYGSRSPHWLYNDYTYRTSGPEITWEVIRAAGCVNRYDHYLRRGSHEGRQAHLLFDVRFYRAALPADEVATLDGVGAFHHFLQRVVVGAGEMQASIYFDPYWYRGAYPELAAVLGSEWTCALHHYLTNGTPTAYDPLPDFSEAAYLEWYPDVAKELKTGNLRNAYHHFLTNGVFELRSPSDAIDLRHYVSAHQSVREDLEAGRARDGFAHLLQIGRPSGLAYSSVFQETAEERAARQLFRARAESLLPVFARRPLDFSLPEPADLAVVMVLHNNFALTIQSLGSLRANYGGAIQLILIDSGSNDETRFIARYVRGAQLLRFDANVGYLRGCNAAFANVSAPAVLLLNNDVELAPGAVPAALRRLESDLRIGVVGAKVIRTHGRLQEAGRIVWRDGVTLGYMRDASPLSPEANFARDVDYCSGAFLMLRGEVLQQLERFEEEYAPAYYEDADLCIRAAQAGFRVVYDPAVVVYHYENGSAPNFRAVEAQSNRSRRVFVRRNREYLRFRYIADRRAEAFARSTTPNPHRVLVIEDRIPLRMFGSGFVRSNDVIRTMASLGLQVTVFPVFAEPLDPASVFADFPDTVEVLYDRTLEQLAEFLKGRDGYYDTIWIVRTHNLDRVRPILEPYCAGKGKPPRVILDTEAVGTQRMAQRAALAGEPFDVAVTLGREFVNAALCQQVVAVSRCEAELLRQHGLGDVTVLGHVREVRLTPRPFEERAGLLFVGAIHETDSPNFDGLCWFAAEVLPLIEQELGWETRLTIAGYTGPGVSLERFAQHQRVTLLGAVADTARLYDSHRVFVAPTRYAAGAPYKVYEAASFGLPVVGTTLLHDQLGWVEGREILSGEAADPAGFARQVVALYRDAAVWSAVRDGAARRLEEENGECCYRHTLRTLLTLS